MNVCLCRVQDCQISSQTLAISNTRNGLLSSAKSIVKHMLSMINCTTEIIYNVKVHFIGFAFHIRMNNHSISM